MNCSAASSTCFVSSTAPSRIGFGLGPARIASTGSGQILIARSEAPVALLRGTTGGSFQRETSKTLEECLNVIPMLTEGGEETLIGGQAEIGALS